MGFRVSYSYNNSCTYNYRISCCMHWYPVAAYALVEHNQFNMCTQRVRTGMRIY